MILEDGTRHGETLSRETRSRDTPSRDTSYGGSPSGGVECARGVDAVALLAEVHRLRWVAAGLADPMEGLCEDGWALTDVMRHVLASRLSDLAGSPPEGRPVMPDAGAVSSVLLALNYARELSESTLLDAAVVAHRLIQAASVWQSMLAGLLADRRVRDARDALFERLEDEAAAGGEFVAAPDDEASQFPGWSVGDLAWEVADQDDLASRSAIAEVAAACGTAEGTLAHQVQVLRSVWDHPEVVSALRAGRVDLRRAGMIVHVTGDLPPEVRQSIDREVLSAIEAAHQTPRQVARLLERLLAQRAPEHHEARVEHEHRTRTGVRTRAAGYGLASMTVTADALLVEDAAAAVATLTALAGTPADEESTGGANSAVVVLELLRTAAESGAGLLPAPAGGATAAQTRATINLTVPLSTLRPPGDADPGPGPTGGRRAGVRPLPAHPTEPGWRATGVASRHGPDAGHAPEPWQAPAELTGNGWIPAALAREIVAECGAHATWRCHYLDDDPGSPHHGTIVGVGRAAHDPTYAPSTSTRHYVIARDRTCRFPGCERRASACDLDHVVPHARGGPTCGDNIVALCRHHHRLKHRGGFTPRRHGVALLWTTPTGRRLRVVPHRLTAEQPSLPDPPPTF